jgi:hypothetical protein
VAGKKMFKNFIREKMCSIYLQIEEVTLSLERTKTKKTKKNKEEKGK